MIADYGTLKTGVADWLARSDLTSYIPDFINMAHARLMYGVKGGPYPTPPLRIRAMERAVPIVLNPPQSGTDSGAANAYVVTSTTPFTAYAQGTFSTFLASASNTGACTVNVDGLGVKSIKKPNGTDDLEVGDILTGAGVNIYYDGTVFRLCDPGCVPLPSNFLSAKRIYLDGNPTIQVNYYTPEAFSDTFNFSYASRPSGFTTETDFIRFGPQPDSNYFGRMLYYEKFAALSADADTNWVLTNSPNAYLYGALIEAAPFIKDDNRLAIWAEMYRGIVSGLQDSDTLDRHSGSALQMRTDVAPFRAFR